MDAYDRSIGRREHQHIIDLIEAVRDAVGPYVDLAVDLHRSFNMTDALRICRDVEHLTCCGLKIIDSNEICISELMDD